MPLYGIYYLFSAAPLVSLEALLWVLTVGVLWPMRFYFEGVAYNAAYSSKFGDIALLGIVLLAHVLVRYQQVELPVWAGWKFHLVVGVMAVGIGTFMVFGPTPLWRSQVTDNYHNFFVVGLFVFLLVTSALVLWRHSYAALFAGLALLAVWAVFMYHDVQTGRMDQRAYLEKQGVKFKN